MTVCELIRRLELLDHNAEVLTNACEASSRHEEICELDTVELVEGHVYVGTGPAR